MPHERPRDVFRQRARECAVDQAGDLGDDHVVGRRAELVAEARAAARAGKNASRPAAAAEADRCSSSGGVFTTFPSSALCLQALREELERASSSWSLARRRGRRLAESRTLSSRRRPGTPLTARTSSTARGSWSCRDRARARPRACGRIPPAPTSASARRSGRVSRGRHPEPIGCVGLVQRALFLREELANRLLAAHGVLDVR